MTKTDSRCAQCSRAKSSHPFDDVERGESCVAFVQRVKNPAMVKLGKNNKRRGYQAEAVVAKLVGGQRDRASVGDVLVRGTDGRAYASLEIKKRRVPKALKDHMEQAERDAVRHPERPPAYVVWFDHDAGPKSRQHIYVVERIDTWVQSHGVGAG